MRGDYRNVTVTQLLTFTGGFQPYMQVPNKFQLKGSPAEEREQFIEHLLQEEPVVKPGTERVYSNASYALVAFVAEQRTGKSWETLMQSEVFKPLGMTTAGFGRPRSKDRPNEPTMHINDGDGYKPEDDERANAMRPVAPAGDVHCSIRDFAKFASYELNAAQGNDALLGPATAQRWQELSRRPGPAGGEGKGGKTKKGKRENEEPKSAKPVSGERPPGQQVEAGGNTKSDGWSFSGGSPAVCTGCILWPSINLATVVAINGGFARDAVQAAFEAIKEREAEFVK
jgi:CubicO group peptidase (beta-lactamase class C family)